MLHIDCNMVLSADTHLCVSVDKYDIVPTLIHGSYHSVLAGGRVQVQIQQRGWYLDIWTMVPIELPMALYATVDLLFLVIFIAV